MKTQNYTALEGETFMFPLCVFTNIPATNLQAVINWGDGSKETISNLNQGSIPNHFFKIVEKKYTFPGTFNISIQAKRLPNDPFADGLKRVAQHNMTVLPTTLMFAPSSDLLVTDYGTQLRSFNMLVYDGATPHSFVGKKVRSNIFNGISNAPMSSFVITVDNAVPGKLNISMTSDLIAAVTLGFVHSYVITEEPDPPTTNPPLSSLILQGRLRRTSLNANGLKPGLII